MKSRKEKGVVPSDSQSNTTVNKERNTTTPDNRGAKFSTTTIRYNDSLFKKIFFASLVFMLGTLWISGYDVPFHSDEMDMNVYTKNNLAYYSSGGADTSYLYIDHHDDIAANHKLRYYPCGFDYLAVGLNTVIGNTDGYEYNVRHALNQLFAVLAILFAGLLTRMFTGYRGALITIWLLFLTPIFFGLALFNTKDIPFSTGYIASLYFIMRFLKGLPNINKRNMVGMVVAIAFACNVRVGGLLLIAYLCCFTAIYVLQNRAILHQRKIIIRLISVIALTTVIVLATMVLLWPYVLSNPIGHMNESINAALKFPQDIPFNFNGEYISSLYVPKSYIPIYFIRTVPVIILIVFIGSLVIIYLKSRLIFKTGVWLLLVAIIFPVVYSVAKDVSLYNSWRHFLFIYPPFVVIAGMGIDLLIQGMNKPSYQYAVPAILIIGMLHPISWIVRSHPYEYMYYNEPAGGFSNNYYAFETDYWQISTREGLDWLIEQENLQDLKDTVLVATNSVSALNYYVRKRYPGTKIKIVTSGYNYRTVRAWTYAIFSNQFLSGFSLEHYFPPEHNLVHTVEVEDMAMTVVLKDTIRYDKIAQNYYYEDKLAEADSVFNLLKEQHNGNFQEHHLPLMGFLAVCKAYLEQYEAAQYYAGKAVAYDDHNYEGNLVLGILSYYRNDFANARKHLSIAVEERPSDTQAREFLNMLPAP